jgi:hypothetical protein
MIQPQTGVPDQFFSHTYFRQNQYYYYEKDAEKLSPERQKMIDSCNGPRITAFNSGNVYFPYHMRHEILKMISYDIETESPMYWNQMAYETPNEGFRLVVDLDSDTRVLEKTEIHKLTRILWLTLKAYYTDFDIRPIDIYMAKCGPRIKKKNLSTGVHIICHVRVTIPQAQQIIYAYDLRLKQDKGINMKGINIDAGIYKPQSKQCSTRMIYCHKVEKCPMCEDVFGRRQACNFCNKDGAAISKSTYEPMGCFNPQTGKPDPEYFNQKNPDFFEIVKNYSIWPEENDEKHTYTKPIGDPTFTSEEKLSKSGKVRQGPALSTKVKKLRTTDPSYALLEEYIQNLEWKGNHWWGGITITKIVITENERLAWVYISGVGCTMCPYAMKDHGDNRIWFSLSRTGVLTVYCHSVKEEYGCKTQDKIQFTLPGKIPQHVFGLEGPPSLNKKMNATDLNFSFEDFMKKQNSLDHVKYDPQADNRKKMMKRLSDFYALGK